MISLLDLIYQEAEYEAECFLNKYTTENSSVNNDDGESVVTTAAVTGDKAMDEEEDLLLDPHEAAIMADIELIERHHFLINHQQQH
jgi:hypothetical protein